MQPCICISSCRISQVFVEIVSIVATDHLDRQPLGSVHLTWQWRAQHALVTWLTEVSSGPQYDVGLAVTVACPLATVASDVLCLPAVCADDGAVLVPLPPGQLRDGRRGARPLRHDGEPAGRRLLGGQGARPRHGQLHRSLGRRRPSDSRSDSISGLQTVLCCFPERAILLS